jgi:hypothetical protein
MSPREYDNLIAKLQDENRFLRRAILVLAGILLLIPIIGS